MSSNEDRDRMMRDIASFLEEMDAHNAYLHARLYETRMNEEEQLLDNYFDIAVGNGNYNRFPIEIYNEIEVLSLFYLRIKRNTRTILANLRGGQNRIVNLTLADAQRGLVRRLVEYIEFLFATAAENPDIN
ncbi:unnamed protein product [Caenorhabditis angaria]|uniref:Uncharacterized protein n=1 Tax=Caenorhabditis angaria TaxID=860376 RepID=A0A9P1J149_9PELO|nr:unnamed protein product [Caenorhabditis angaria]